MQTQFILEAMSKTSEEGNTRWDQIMGNFDLLFAQINDLGLITQDSGHVSSGGIEENCEASASQWSGSG